MGCHLSQGPKTWGHANQAVAGKLKSALTHGAKRGLVAPAQDGAAHLTSNLNFSPTTAQYATQTTAQTLTQSSLSLGANCIPTHSPAPLWFLIPPLPTCLPPKAVAVSTTEQDHHLCHQSHCFSFISTHSAYDICICL